MAGKKRRLKTGPLEKGKRSELPNRRTVTGKSQKRLVLKVEGG